ncbi:MAG: NAD(P)H-dependent oxidoreductase [Deltaproteobacteria bacterium]|jgi:flavodoxin|nr:NAD(P)H-dependent oxidoreductase [Deltaproteobacteria bacterium]
MPKVLVSLLRFFRAAPALAGDGGRGTLVAFFSHSGNTRKVAGFVREFTGGALFEIKVEKLYPADFQQTITVAGREKETKARPSLADSVHAMEGFRTVFLGYPNWWYDMPMPVYSFLEAYDFEGKIVAPFCTHGGSGLSSTVAALREILPRARVLEGLAVPGKEAETASDAVRGWLSRVGFMQ